MYRGSGTDHPLSNLGWRQMRASISNLNTEQETWTRIITSPMSRCLAFAEELSGKTGLPIEVRDGLVEAGYGEW